jgi:DNA-binding MarR family transcriptional regulator
MRPLYELALSIKASHRELDRRVNELMSELGLTEQQADALYVIGLAGTLSLGELGELLIAEAGHPSRLVDRLVEAGYVQRVVAADDRRRVVLSLSPAGRELHGQIVSRREALFELAEALLDSDQVEAALALFREQLTQTAYADLIARRAELELRGEVGAGAPG